MIRYNTIRKVFRTIGGLNMVKLFNSFGRKVWLGFIAISLAICLTCGSIGILTTSRAVAETDAITEPETETTQAEENIETSATTYTFGYTGNVQSRSLPAGVYKLEVWGAEGATGYNQGTAGKGGYSVGLITLSSTTTVYVVVGGTGRTSSGTHTSTDKVRTVAGYNGGGAGNGNTGAWGGAGGGATHIATRTGVLKDLASYKSSIFIVAGGGGGGGHKGQSGYTGGAGGGTSGIAGGSGVSVGTQSSGYAFGQGMSTTGHDMGAGGGGYWGGKGSVTSDKGGSGGSGYIGGVTSNSTYGVTAKTIAGNASMPSTSGGTETGHAGDGYAKITSLNSPPSNNGTEPSVSKTRGTSQEWLLSTIAKDVDTTTKDTFKFYDQKIYLASNNADASSYLRATFTNAGNYNNAAAAPKFSVTPIRYFTKTRFYIKVVDNHGSVGNVYFNVTVTDQAPTLKAGTYGTGESQYRVGRSTTANPDDATNANTSVIYNPNHNSGVKDTVIIPSPIPLNSSVIVQATDLFRDSDADDRIRITAVSAYGGASEIYSITREGYESVGGTGAYGSIKITANKSPTTATGYQCLTVSVSSIDSKSGITPSGAAKTIQLVFKIDNTRPIYIGSQRMSETPYKDLANQLLGDGDLVVRMRSGSPAQRLYFSPTDYQAHKNEANTYAGFVAWDIDGNTNSIAAVSVPTAEYVYVDKYNTALQLKAGSNYNNAHVATNSWSTGTGDISTAPTGFKASFVAVNGTDTSEAYVSYYIDPNGKYIEFTPLKATQNMYKKDGVTDATRQGHFYIMVRVIDSGNMNDGGIWYPIAIQIDNTNPTSMSPIASAEGALYDDKGVATNVSYFTPLDAVGVLSKDSGLLGTSGAPFVPGIATDIDIFKATNGSLNQFVLLDTSSPLIKKVGDVYYLYDNEYFTITLEEMRAHGDLIRSIPASILAAHTNSVTDQGENKTPASGVADIKFLQGEGVGSSQAHASQFAFYGIKVVRHKSTQGKYIEALIPVKDTAGGKADVSLYIKSDNVSIKAKGASDVNRAMYTLGKEDSAIGSTEIKVGAVFDDENKTLTVTYSVYSNSIFYISPYDLVRDVDSLSDFDETNSNYLASNGAVNAKFLTQLDKLKGAENRWKLSSSRGEAAVEGTLPYDTLSFSNSPQLNGSGYGTLTMPTASNPCFEISADKVTPSSAPMQFRATVTDGNGTSVDVIIKINVLNNAPYLKDSADWQQGHVYYMQSNFNSLGYTTKYESSENADLPLKDYGDIQYVDPNESYYKDPYSIREFTVHDIAGDIESTDKLSFYGTRITIETLNIVDGKIVYDDKGNPFKTLENGSSFVEVSYDLSSMSRGRVLKVVAKSSTRNLEGGLFVCVQVSDGSDGLSEFRLQIEVLNSDVTVNNDSQTGFEPLQENINAVDKVRNVWKIDAETNQDKTASRYLVSNAKLYDTLIAKDSKINNKTARILVADNDASQQFALVGNPTALPKLYEASLINYTSESLQASSFGEGSVLFDYPFQGEDVPSFDDVKNGLSGESALIRIHYYDALGESVTPQSGAEYVNWAIEYRPLNVSYKQEQLTIAVYVKDTLATGGDGAVYKGTRPCETESPVDGKRILFVNIRIGALGIINTFERYTEALDTPCVHGTAHDLDNQYYVADGDGTRTYKDFVYNPINVASTALNIPVSYFALPKSLVPDQKIPNANDNADGLAAWLSAHKIEYIGFKTSSERRAYASGEILKSVTLSDGNTEWTGATLNNNPYVDISVVSREDGTVPGGFTGGNMVGSKTYGYVNKEAGYIDDTGAYAPLTDPGYTMLEHTFGLNLARKGSRSNGSLTLKVELQLWQYRDGEYKPAEANNEPISTIAVIPLTIPNRNLKFVNKSYTDDSNTIDLSMKMGNSTGVMLIDESEEGNLPKDGTVAARYQDDDFYNSTYKDKAYYLNSSVSALSNTRLNHMFDAAGTKKPVDIDLSPAAQKALYGYFKMDVPADEDAADAYDAIAAKFVSGIYNANEGYQNYFTVSQVDNGTSDSNLLTFTPKHKTTFNLTTAATGATDADKIAAVQAAAATRKLVAEYKGSGDVTKRNNWKIYYPFKVIVYDQFGNSGWENSSYQILNINVEIVNSDPDVNELYKTEGSAIGVSLTKDTPVTFSLADLIIDRDMYVVPGASGNKYATESDIKTLFTDWNVPGSEDQRYYETTDYLAYTGFYDRTGKLLPEPEFKDNQYIYNTGAPDTITATVDPSTQILTLLAKERPESSEPIRFTIYIGDNNGAYATLTFSVKVTNKIPYGYTNKDNEVAFTTFNVTMKSGDYFYLAVTSFEKFSHKAGTESLKMYNDSSTRLSPLEKATVTSGRAWSDYTEDDFEAFQYGLAKDEDVHNPFRGLLAVADDDTPWKLRFTADANTVNSAYTTGLSSYFTITPYDIIPTDDGRVSQNLHGYPLVYGIKANGAVKNANLRFTVRDEWGQDSYLTINVNITVESTPPNAITSEDVLKANNLTLEKVEGRTVEYKTTMHYGEKREFKTGNFVTDPDALDAEKLYFYNAFNNYLSINGDKTGKTSSINFTFTEGARVTGTSNVKSFIAECTNIFTTDVGMNPYDEITFYVMDPSGTDLNKDAILVKLHIYTEYQPVDATRIYEETSRHEPIPVSVKSREAYEKDNVAQNVRLIKRTADDQSDRNAAIVDEDYGSGNLTYNVALYALLEENGEGKIVNADFDKVYDYSERRGVRGVFDPGTDGQSKADASQYFLLRWQDKKLTIADESSAVYKYVTQYMDIDIEPDGTSLNIKPKMKLDVPFSLYVEVSKAVNFNSPLQSETVITAGTVYEISVQNSAPKAVVNNNVNSTQISEYKWLEFYGVKGSEHAWPLYNPSVPQQALFYDTDAGDRISFKSMSLESAVVSEFYEVDQALANKLGRYYEGKYTLDKEIAVKNEDGSYKKITVNSGYKGQLSPPVGQAIDVTEAQVQIGTEETDEGPKPIMAPGVRVTINRKLSSAQEEIEVIPLKITGEDSSRARVSTVVWIYIGNTSPQLKDYAGEDTKYQLTNEAEEDAPEKWVLRATVEKGHDLTIRTSDIVEDADGNFDVLKFVDAGSSNAQSSLHIIDRKPEVTLHLKGTGQYLNTTLFDITTNDRNSEIKISCVSTARAAEATAYLCFGDNGDKEGSPSRTPVVQIVLTVANSAPTVREDAELVINLKGGEMPQENNGQFAKSYFNILDYVTDLNESDIAKDHKGGYVRIGFMDTTIKPDVSTGESSSPDDEGMGNISGEDIGLFLASVADAESDAAAGDDYKEGISASQVFWIRPIAKRYGRQRITVTVYDDGGMPVDHPDYKELTITIVVNVARAETEQTTNDVTVNEGVQIKVTAESILDDMANQIQYSIGYELVSLTLDAAAENLVTVGQSTDINNIQYWYVQGRVGEDKCGKSCSVVANFKVAKETVKLPFTVHLERNPAPKLQDSYTNLQTKVFYDSGLVEGMIQLRPNDVFQDDGVMRFVSVESKQKMICEATLDKETNTILLNFLANKPVELSIGVTDETGRTVTETIVVQLPSAPKLNFFANMVVMIQQHMLYFLIIVGAFLLFLIILIIIIVTVRKKRKMRKEIEALLVSEMELEEQMLKLSAPNPTFYQSYGYLPPTQQPQSNPGFMLDNGQTANNPGTIGLNPGAPNTPPPTDPNDLDNF